MRATILIARCRLGSCSVLGLLSQSATWSVVAPLMGCAPWACDIRYCSHKRCLEALLTRNITATGRAAKPKPDVSPAESLVNRWCPELLTVRPTRLMDGKVWRCVFCGKTMRHSHGAAKSSFNGHWNQNKKFNNKQDVQGLMGQGSLWEADDGVSRHPWSVAVFLSWCAVATASSEGTSCRAPLLATLLHSLWLMCQSPSRQYKLHSELSSRQRHEDNLTS